MRSTSHWIALTAALALAASSCAHVPARDPAAGAVVWPAPPAEPRARLIGSHPDPKAPRPRRAWWKAALEWITGTEQREEDRRALVRPFGVAFDGAGALYAADPDAARVVRIDARGTLEDVACEDVPWAAPIAVALAPDGTLLVADAGAGHLVRWSVSGCRILGAGMLERPTGVAVGSERIWVADP